MGNVFKFELRKLFTTKSFYICGIVSVGLIILTAILNKVISTVNIIPAEAMENASDMVAQNSGLSDLLVAASSGSVLLVGGIFVSIFVCTDFQKKTIRTVITKGITRSSFITAKYLICVIALLVMAVVDGIVAFLLNSILFGIGDLPFWDLLFRLLAQYFAIAAQAIVAATVAFIVGRSSGAIAINVVAPTMLGPICSGLNLLVKQKFDFNKLTIDYYFVQMLNLENKVKDVVVVILASIAFIAVFSILCHILIRRREY